MQGGRRKRISRIKTAGLLSLLLFFFFDAVFMRGCDGRERYIFAGGGTPFLLVMSWWLQKRRIVVKLLLFGWKSLVLLLLLLFLKLSAFVFEMSLNGR